MLPAAPPEEPVDMETIFADFERIVPEGMTHWQHRRFFAYFPANAAPASMIAENLTSVMAAQCMLWQTSPAATEIETRMVDWMRQALGLPEGFQGVIQDTGTTANLCAVLTMRERALGWRGNDSGMAGERQLRVYASPETHSSIDKAVRIAGIGQQHLVKVPTDGSWALDPEALRAAIEADLAAGLLPAGVVLCIGGTSVGASDRLRESIEVAREHDLYVHVDAAWAGSAMICPELRELWDGRRGGRQHRLQSPQVARCAVRLHDPVSGGPGTAGPHPRGSSGVSPDPRPERDHQLQRVDNPPGAPVPRPQALVPAARPRARRPPAAHPEPHRLGRGGRRRHRIAGRLPPDHGLPPLALHVPVRPEGRVCQRRHRAPAPRRQRRRPDLPDAHGPRGPIRHPLPGRAVRLPAGGRALRGRGAAGAGPCER